MDKVENKSLPKLYLKNSIQRVDSKDIAVIKEHGQQLSKLNKDNPQSLITAVAAMIESVYTLVNVGKQIKAEAIIMLSEMIIEKYYYLKIDEIDLVFKRGIMGEYGKIYDRVDANVIFDWLYKYDVSEECISIYETKVDQFKKREHDSPLLEIAEFRERIKKDLEFNVKSGANLLSESEHKEEIRRQAENIMRENKETKKEAN